MLFTDKKDFDMKIDEILDLWKEDCKVDPTEIGEESIKIAKLHHKYYQILVHERLILKSRESEMKKLKLEKYEFFTQGPNEETKSKGWNLPAKGIILKTDIPMYLEADEDIIQLSLKIGIQAEKIDLLESIIKAIMNRGYNLKLVLDWEKFKNGV
jgi:hypothetical protein